MIFRKTLTIFRFGFKLSFPPPRLFTFLPHYFLPPPFYAQLSATASFPSSHTPWGFFLVGDDPHGDHGLGS